MDYHQLLLTKPHFINTKNSYERHLLYKALEKHGNIWCQRKKIYKDIYTKSYMCNKHKCYVIADEYEGEYMCNKCPKGIYRYNNCIDVLYPNELLYHTKITIGLNIFYEKTNIGKLKYFPPTI